LAAFFIIFRASQHLKQARINEELLKEINERKSLEIEQQKLTKNLYHSQKMEAIWFSETPDPSSLILICRY